MFKETDILKFISSKRRQQNLLTVSFPENSANFPTKKHIPFRYLISVKNIIQSISCNIWHIFACFADMLLMQYRQKQCCYINCKADRLSRARIII